jgi:hypothetical protein
MGNKYVQKPNAGRFLLSPLTVSLLTFYDFTDHVLKLQTIHLKWMFNDIISHPEPKNLQLTHPWTDRFRLVYERKKSELSTRVACSQLTD